MEWSEAIIFLGETIRTWEALKTVKQIRSGEVTRPPRPGRGEVDLVEVVCVGAWAWMATGPGGPGTWRPGGASERGERGWPR